MSTRSIFFLFIIFLSHLQGYSNRNEVLNLGNDTVICDKESIILSAGNNRFRYLWQDGSTTSKFKVSTPGLYWCEVSDVGENLIINGDFENGSMGFVSDYYGASNNLVPEGRFYITKNPNRTHGSFSNCNDHTSGGGMQMVVNGSTRSNTVVWSQKIKVLPNTEYRFSTWGTSVLKGNPAVLQFSINGFPIGPIFSLKNEACTWNQYFQTWNSGNNSEIEISILNQNLMAGGNDFSLDDIYFAPVIKQYDTIEVSIAKSTAVNLGNDTNLCQGQSLILNANVYEAAYIQWSTGDTGGQLFVDRPGNYSVMVSDSFGCTISDEININYTLLPRIDLGSDTTICDNEELPIQLAKSKFNYLWSDGSSNLNKTFNTGGVYWVMASHMGCISSDTIQINIKESPKFSLGNDTILKNRVPYELNPKIEGEYLWQNRHDESTYVSRIDEYVTLKVTSINQCYSVDTVKISRYKYSNEVSTKRGKKIIGFKEERIIGYRQTWDIVNKRWRQEPVVQLVSISENKHYEYFE